MTLQKSDLCLAYVEDLYSLSEDAVNHDLRIENYIMIYFSITLSNQLSIIKIEYLKTFNKLLSTFDKFDLLNNRKSF